MSKPVVTAKADTNIKSAIKSLYEKHVGSIVVTSDKGQCKGIFTERDALRIIAGDVSLNSPLERFMTRNPITIHEGASLNEAIAIMIRHGIRHLPVVDNERQVIGILSIRNFLDEVVGIRRAKA